MKVSRIVVASVGVWCLAGCAGPFHAGAAATVGDQRISTTELRGIIGRGLAAVPPGAPAVNPVRLQQQTLTQLIRLQVLRAMAAAEHVVVDQQDISAVLTQAAASTGMAALDQSANSAGVATADLPLYASVSAYQQKVLAAVPVSAAALQAAYDKNARAYEQVHVAHILVSTRALALQILAQLKVHPSLFAALAAKYSIDPGSKNKGGDLGFASHGDYVAPFENAAFGGRDGTIVGPVQSQFGYHLIKIIQHRTLTLAQVGPRLLSPLQQSSFTAAYAAEETQLHIHVSPRFGVWVPHGGQDGFGDVEALPATGDLSVPVSPTGSVAATPAANGP